MVVQHNMQAMNANRMLNVTTGQQAKSTEKLSSGYRINRAADDAAGLSISEKMRRQIRGLDQASSNAQDGISCVQTAEGALTEVHSMLQRMNELAVQAGNGTMSADDRSNIQDEIDQLITEIDRVSETTKFNETYLLKGDGTEERQKTTTTGMTAGYKNAITKTIVEDATGAYTANSWFEAGGTTGLADKDAVKNLLEVNDKGEIVLKAGKKLYKKVADTTNQFGNQLKAEEIDITAIRALFKVSSNALFDGSGAEVKGEDLKSYFNEDGTYKGGLQAMTTAGALKEVGADQIGNFVNVTAGNTTTENYTATKALTLSFQVGAETTKENKIAVQLDSMSAEGIGVKNVTVTGNNSDNADTAVNTIAEAIKQVSSQRSALGAVQNRLEHTIANLDNVVENTTAAESRIRDTDMAEEMVEYSKNNILAQAGQSMLAQANQSTQGVLSLLQ